MGLRVTRAVLARLLEEARAAAPAECCGLLLARRPLAGGALINRVLPAANVAGDPLRRFEIDPAVLLAAHKAARSGGPAIAGYYHSHPHGRSEPSPADRAAAGGDGRVWAIVAAGEIGFWRNRAGGFDPLSIELADD